MRLLYVLLPVVFLVSFGACTKRKDENPNTLNVAVIAKLKGIDPAVGEDIYQTYAEMLVFEPLVSYHPFKRPFTLVANTAETMPEVSKDGLTYTFKIRKGVFFHDDPAFPNGQGRELTAKDYEYSLKRVADPRIKSNGWWLFENHIKGLDEWKAKYEKDATAKVNYDEEVEGLKAIDANTLRIVLKGPYPQLLNALAMSTSVAVAREVVDKYGPDFLNHAVGTGPFIVKQFDPADHVTYVKNPKYWGKFPDDADSPKEYAGKQLPLVDGVNLRVIVEDQPRWLHFLKGEIDVLSIPKDNFTNSVKVKDPSKPASVDNVELTEELSKKGIEAYGGVSMDFTYDAFNTESKVIPQFQNKKIRQAISLALTYDDAIPLLYNNRAIPAQTPIPPNLGGYDAKYKNPWRQSNVELARKMLAEAGYPGGKGFPVIPFDSTADSTARQFAEYVQRKLETIGLKMEVVSNTWPAMNKRIKNREAQFWGIAWGGDYPDAENFLQLFYGKNAYPAGTNASYYKNPEYDKLFEKARVLPEGAERAGMYHKLAEMVAEDAPVVMGVHRVSVRVKQAWVRNELFDDVMPFPRAKYNAIDLETKKKYGQ